MRRISSTHSEVDSDHDGDISEITPSDVTESSIIEARRLEHLFSGSQEGGQMVLFDFSGEGKNVAKGEKIKISSKDRTIMKRNLEEKYQGKSVILIDPSVSKFEQACPKFALVLHPQQIGNFFLMFKSARFPFVKEATRNGLYVNQGEFYCISDSHKVSTDKVTKLMKHTIDVHNTICVQIYPQNESKSSDIVFLNFEEVNIAFIGLVVRKPVLVKISLHQTPWKKETAYMECYATDTIGKMKRMFAAKSKLGHIKLTLKEEELDEMKPLEAYLTDGDRYLTDDMYMIRHMGLSPQRRKYSVTLTFTAHLLGNSNVKAYVEKRPGVRCIIYINKDGSTRSLREEVSKLIHKDPSCIQLSIKNVSIPEVPCLNNVTFFEENSTIQISYKSQISLKCSIMGDIQVEFSVNVYPFESSENLISNISKQLKVEPFQMDIIYRGFAITDTTNGIEFHHEEKLVIVVHRHRIRISVIVSAALVVEGVQRRGFLTIDNSTKTTVAEVLRYFSVLWRKHANDLRLVHCSESLCSEMALSDAGVFDSSTVVLSLCPRVHQDVPPLVTIIEATEDGSLASEIQCFVIKGFPLYAHPDIPFDLYKQMMEKGAKSTSDESPNLKCPEGLCYNGHQNSRFSSADKLSSSHSGDKEDKETDQTINILPIQQNQSSQEGKIRKKELLQRARQVRKKISRSDGDYSDTETRNSTKPAGHHQSIDATKTGLEHSKSDGDLKRKTRVRFSDSCMSDSTVFEEEQTTVSTSHGNKPDSQILKALLPSADLAMASEPLTSDGSEDDSLRIIQKEKRERFVYQLGGTIMQRETVVNDQILHPISSVEGLRAGPVITELSNTDSDPTFMHKVATEIGKEWKKVGRYLQLKEADIENIETSQCDLHERSFQMLKVWRKQGGSKATDDVLARALEDASLGSVAELIRSKSVDSVSSTEIVDKGEMTENNRLRTS